MGLLSAAIALSGCVSNGGAVATPVTFRTEDGFLLEGKVYGEGARAVVLAHMFESEQSSWAGFARRLAKEGFQALTFNFRGYGESQGRKDVAIIDRDVKAAVRYLLEKRQADRVVLVGASMGGTASIVAASAIEVQGVVTVSAPVSFRGLDAASAARLVTAPALMVAAQDDQEAASSAEDLYRAVAGPRDLRIVAGRDHGTDLLQGSQGSRVTDLLRSFISEVAR